MELITQSLFVFTLVFSLMTGSLLAVLMYWLKLKPSPLVMVLTVFGASITSFWIKEIESELFLIGQLMMWGGLIGLGCILRAQDVNKGLKAALFLWIGLILGWLIGLQEIGFALVGATVFALILITYGTIQRNSFQPQSYAAELTLDSSGILSQLETLIDSFDITIERKRLKHDDQLRILLWYTTTPLNQHLFLKRLYELDDIEKVVSV